METNSTPKNTKLEFIGFAIAFVAVFVFIAFFLYNNQTGEDKEAKMALIVKEAKETNETIQMLIEVAYKNDTTRFNDYQKHILKAVIADNIPEALDAMTPGFHKHKLTFKK